MTFSRSFRVAVFLVTTCCATQPTVPTAAAADAPIALAAPPIAWRSWDKDAFEHARTEKRIVIVTIATQWCHWCHVMDEETWANGEVRALVAARFVAIREDADARPDLAERYADWGWPATALLSPDGSPILELRGYQERGAFLALLKRLVATQDAGKPLARVVTAEPRKPSSDLGAIRAIVATQLQTFWDPVEGGWGTPQKYPFWAAIEASLAGAALRGDEDARARALRTLSQAQHLIDPVAGGMFQYSLQGTWTAPHYEKLAEVNGALLGSYALAVTVLQASAPNDARAAERAGRALHGWLATTLRAPSGAFYANQDADVGTRGERPHLLGKAYYALDAEGRSRAGTPFVDTQVYAAHNGRVIAGMARFAGAVGDERMLADAVGAADAVIATHAIDKSGSRGFAHSATDARPGIMHLADQVAMGQAFVELYEATCDDRWRVLAAATTRALVAALWDENIGALRAHTVDATTPALDVRMPMRGNAEAARLLMKIGRLEEDKALVSKGERTLRHFADAAIVKEEGRIIGEYLLAVEEALHEPLHFAIVASHADDVSRALLRAALRVHAPHRLVEVTPPGKYPDIGRPALYICGASFCSPPIVDPAAVAKKAQPFLKPRA